MELLPNPQLLLDEGVPRRANEGGRRGRADVAGVVEVLVGDDGVGRVSDKEDGFAGEFFQVVSSVQKSLKVTVKR